MRTKVTVIGEGPEQKIKLNPIEFCYLWADTERVEQAKGAPHIWENIELIAKNYINGYDLMFAYDSVRSRGHAYLGYFNDGVVE